MVDMQPCLILKPNNIMIDQRQTTSPPNNIVRAMTTLKANVMTGMLSNVNNIAINLVFAAFTIAKSIIDDIIASGGN